MFDIRSFVTIKSACHSVSSNQDCGVDPTVYPDDHEEGHNYVNIEADCDWT